jgi:hypothetical protein
MQTVRVMLSYDYNHFEVCLGVPDEATLGEINDVRKNAMRLCDEAIRQYKIAKELAAQRNDGACAMKNFEADCTRIKQKDPQDRTIKEIAMLKQYEDEEWRSQFKYDYDYDDDYEPDWN